jgi:hypothetical protein
MTSCHMMQIMETVCNSEVYFCFILTLILPARTVLNKLLHVTPENTAGNHFLKI